LPANFSAHAQTLVEQYRIEDGLHALRVRASSPYVGRPREAVELKDYSGLSLVAIQESESDQALKRPTIAEGDLIRVRGMIPLATAMRQTGAAELIADNLIHVIGGFGPRAILVGLFVVTFALTQVMSNTAAALVMLAIAVATGIEMGVSPMPFILGITVAAHSALLTPVATPVNLMVVGPGGYKFGDYWKYGLPIGLWWLVVVAVVIPLYWKF
jgi:Na+/H+ antiporter NhaD/arsenite permease-like protein